MLDKVNFTKMHGLGNDFVIVNREDLPAGCDVQKLAVNISDRRLGIGCDQFIIYHKQPESYLMTVYNQDGSLAKACGNASRCLAKLMKERSNEDNIIIEVSGRKLSCNIQSSQAISVNMGAVGFHESWMPAPEKVWSLAERYMIDPKEILCADAGNPHLIIFSKLSVSDKELIGSKLQNSELFPDGVNVDFVTVEDNNILLSVYERGAGFTLACGSGACASFAATLKLGFVTSPASVIFAAGSLEMAKIGDDIVMTGPAVSVANGVYYYEH